MKDADALRVQAGSRFTTDIKAICGDFNGDDMWQQQMNQTREELSDVPFQR